MQRSSLKRLTALLCALLLVASACGSRDDNDDNGSGNGDNKDDNEQVSSIATEDCASDPTTPIEGDTIKLVSSFPQSGLTAAFAQIYNGWKAYFEMLNEEEGGVEIAGKKYKIETADLDDQYNAAKTAQNIEELVGSNGEKAFAVFSVVGTANNLAIRDFLGNLCVPNLFAATGSPAWGNPDYPWTIGSTLQPYTLEAQAFVDYLKDEDPDATIAILAQDDDFGDAYVEGIQQAIEGTDMKVVGEERYATGASDVGAQVTSLAATNATAFFSGGTLLACPDALKKQQAAGWKAITYTSGTCASKTLMGLAGDAAEGVLTSANVMDPLSPDFADTDAMKTYREMVKKYSPDPAVDLDNGIVSYGWTQAAVFHEALKNAEAPTRLAVMEAVHDLDVSNVGTLREGITVKTSGEDDPYMGESFYLGRYDAANTYFVDVGDVYDYEGKTAELTPEDLIAG